MRDILGRCRRRRLGIANVFFVSMAAASLFALLGAAPAYATFDIELISPTNGSQVEFERPNVAFRVYRYFWPNEEALVTVRMRTSPNDPYEVMYSRTGSQGVWEWKSTDPFPAGTTVYLHITASSTNGTSNKRDRYYQFSIVDTNQECVECHVTYPDAHPVSNCYSCHGDYTGGTDWAMPWPMEPWLTSPAGDCIGCHTYGAPLDQYRHGYDLDSSGATYASYYPTNPLTRHRYQPSHGTGRMYACESCHGVFAAIPECGRNDRIDDHLRRLEAFCTSCHGQNKPEEQKAVSVCLGCHSFN